VGRGGTAGWRDGSDRNVGFQPAIPQLSLATRSGSHIGFQPIPPASTSNRFSMQPVARSAAWYQVMRISLEPLAGEGSGKCKPQRSRDSKRSNGESNGMYFSRLAGVTPPHPLSRREGESERATSSSSDLRFLSLRTPHSELRTNRAYPPTPFRVRKGEPNRYFILFPCQLSQSSECAARCLPSVW
jgi:hypothetical protein